MDVSYYIDGVDFKTYGVFVSSSKGLIGRPELKQPVTLNWETYHGENTDLSSRYYKSREIELDCFIPASSKGDFLSKSSAFLNSLDKAGTRRLMVVADIDKPLLYEVYFYGEIDISKKWRDGEMVGTFTVKLKEPEPIKKVIKYTRTSEGDKTASITVTSTKMLNFYWGDGLNTFDVSGVNQTITHPYLTNGTFYIVVTGNIDDITSLTTNGTVVWNKL